MITFVYTAREKSGVITEGTIDAIDRDEAAHKIAERGMVPVTLKQKSKKLSLDIGALFKKIRGIPALEKVVFARQLATMINAGLPLSQALHILDAQTQNEKMRKVTKDLAKDVEGGLSFSGSLAKHPRVFSTLFVSMVKAGEVGGFLDNVLERLASQLEKDHELNAKIRGAMIYPAVILAAMLGVATLMLILVIPQLAALFKDAGVELPLPTKILILLSDFLIKGWFIAIPLVLFLLYLFRRFLRTKKGKELFDRVILKMPVFGGLTKKISLARFNRMLGSLMFSGIAVIDALEITAQSIGNTKYGKAIEEIAKKVRVGVPVAEPIKTNPLFPPLEGQMLAVGEETGTLDKILERLAIFYENEVDRIVNNLTTILEPLIILVMGVGVAFLVISLILPVLQLSTTF